MRNTILKWLFLGLFIRILFMPLTGHEDTRLINWAGLNIYEKGVESIYETEKSVYPPPIYIFFASWQKIVNPILTEDFKSWVNLPPMSSFNHPMVYRLFFFVKLPYLFFDVGIALLLMKLFKKRKDQENIFKLWMINPVAVYVTFLFGQFDVIPTFFMITALVLALNKKLFLSALFLGISAVFKFFPLYFLPFIVLLGEGKFHKRVLILLAGLFPVLLATVPLLNLTAFQKNVLFGAHTANIGHASLYIGADQRVSVFIILYSLMLLVFLHKKENVDALWKYFLFILLLFYSLTAFHPQWFLWISPFLVVWWVKKENERLLQILLYFLYFLIVLLFEPSVHIGLFGPLSTFFTQIPSLADFTQKFLDPNLIRGYLHSIFAGLSLFTILKISQEKNPV